MKYKNKNYTAVWMENTIVKMIDQRLLPHKFEIIDLKNHIQTCAAIKNMTIRGAGSIGAAAGFAAAQVVLEASGQNFQEYIKKGLENIKSTRPTAQDLFFAVEKVKKDILKTNDIDKAKELAVKSANEISDLYVLRGKLVGKYGSLLIKENFKILTHCNAGWLALQDWGSALAPIYAAKRANKNIFVYVDETRPRMQGSKLTAWELKNEDIPFALIPDNAAGYYMQKKMIDIVITGADRIAANGDAANKIGTYEKAVLAKENNIPFYIAAPLSTFDINCKNGDDIPIEQRDINEVLYVKGKTRNGNIDEVLIAPDGASALNPAFDVTPAKYISGYITNKGIIKADDIKNIL